MITVRIETDGSTWEWRLEGELDEARRIILGVRTLLERAADSLHGVRLITEERYGLIVKP